jgi:hypothetical protein
MSRTLREIAYEVKRDWKNVSPHALPYLNAMTSLDSVNDNYYLDSGDSVVRYFLANAGTWRGETARNTKKELKSMLLY